MEGADTFPIWFFQGFSFLHLEITLPFGKLCDALEEKKIFATIILWKKHLSKLSQNESESIP